MLTRRHSLEPSGAPHVETPMARAPRTRGAVWAAWLRSARLPKTMPIALLLLSGALVSRGSLSFPFLGVALFAVIIASIFMTHLNILTDVELDRPKKPELYAALLAGPLPPSILLVLEAGLVATALALVLATSGWTAALSIGAFALAGVLYSWNFLVPKDPVRTRLKAHWWGHILCVPTGYAALWTAGYAVAGGEDFGLLWPAFALLACSEYALFVLEAGEDARDESARRMRTLGALLGPARTNAVAVAVATASTVALVLLYRGDLLVLLCLVPGCAARAAYLAWASIGRERRTERARLVDAVFLGARLLSLAALGLAQVLAPEATHG